MKELTVLQAFQAMVIFLDSFYNRTKSDDVGSLLGDLMLLSDGSTADPAAWPEWVEIIEEVINAPEEAFNKTKWSVTRTPKGG